MFKAWPVITRDYSVKVRFMKKQTIGASGKHSASHSRSQIYVDEKNSDFIWVGEILEAKTTQEVSAKALERGQKVLELMGEA